MSFAHHFGVLVLPGLRNLTKAEAACIIAGVDTFSSAYDAVMKHAIMLGALHLPEEKFHELEDWIAATLLQEIDAAGADAVQG